MKYQISFQIHSPRYPASYSVFDYVGKFLGPDTRFALFCERIQQGLSDAIVEMTIEKVWIHRFYVVLLEEMSDGELKVKQFLLKPPDYPTDLYKQSPADSISATGGTLSQWYRISQPPNGTTEGMIYFFGLVKPIGYSHLHEQDYLNDDGLLQHEDFQTDEQLLLLLPPDARHSLKPEPILNVEESYKVTLLNPDGCGYVASANEKSREDVNAISCGRRRRKKSGIKKDISKPSRKSCVGCALEKLVEDVDKLITIVDK